MSIAILILLLCILTFTDIKEYRLPNVIIFPAIVLGCILTSHYIPMLIAFLSVALLTKDSKYLRWSGGDVKLFALIASFIGWMFIPVLIMTNILLKIYRELTNSRLGLPLAPFASVSTLIVITAVAIFHTVCKVVA